MYTSNNYIVDYSYICIYAYAYALFTQYILSIIIEYICIGVYI